MIEIIKGSSETLVLRTGTEDVPQDSEALPIVSVYDEANTEIYRATANRIDIGVYHFTTPAILSLNEGVYRVVWSYSLLLNGTSTPLTKEQHVVVVTPYISVERVVDRYPEDDTIQALYAAGGEQLRDAEKTVRYIINSFVGQSFSLEPNTTHEILGRGLKELYLPKRLARLTRIEDLDGRLYNGQIDAFTNFSIRRGDDTLLYSSYTDGQTLYGAPIGARSRSGRWGEGIYLVTGDWGWTFVPQEVEEAAGLLVKDSFNPDSKYFDMYVDNIRASDWRMEFAKTGDRTTGNAKADLLLSRFHTGNWTLI